MGTIADTFDQLVVANLAALRLASIYARNITAALIRKWASRGLIKARGERGRAKLYSMRELETLAERLYGQAAAPLPGGV